MRYQSAVAVKLLLLGQFRPTGRNPKPAKIGIFPRFLEINPCLRTALKGAAQTVRTARCGFSAEIAWAESEALLNSVCALDHF